MGRICFVRLLHNIAGFDLANPGCGRKHKGLQTGRSLKELPAHHLPPSQGRIEQCMWLAVPVEATTMRIIYALVARGFIYGKK